MHPDYPRDLVGYGARVPNPQWPRSAKLALQIVLNYEEGAEQSILHGDAASETFLSEMQNPRSYEGVRHKSMESLYEFGSRAGVWRLLRTFEQRDLPVTIFGVAMALQRNPEAVVPDPDPDLTTGQILAGADLETGPSHAVLIQRVERIAHQVDQHTTHLLRVALQDSRCIDLLAELDEFPLHDAVFDHHSYQGSQDAAAGRTRMPL